MPNWCYITLEITGPEKEIDSIMRSGLDFEKILPTPKKLIAHNSALKELFLRLVAKIRGDKWYMEVAHLTESQMAANLAEYGHEYWYSWRMENWGVKWNPKDGHNDIKRVSPVKIEAALITSWGVPLKILQHISRSHPNTEIHITDCEEESGEFVGSLKILNGEVVEDTVHKPTECELRERNMLCEEGD